MSRQVAFITGGASGMGLAVATALSKRGNWDLHLIDLNASSGEQAASSLPNAFFHQTNVNDYSQLVGAFEAAFNQFGRIDFVYANAGIVEKDNFYEDHDLSKPPPEPNQLSIDINFKAVVNTTYLARHYFRKNPRDVKSPVLIMTASCGGLYPSEFCPMYSGSKAAVIHFNRTIAYKYHMDGIRTYATAPGTIVTNLLASDDWKAFPEQFFTPMETLVHAVLKLIDGGDMEDSTGKRIAEKDAWGLCVEVNGKNFYFRDGVPACDQNMAEMMKYTSMEHQLKRLEKEKAKKQQE